MMDTKDTKDINEIKDEQLEQVNGGIVLILGNVDNSGMDDDNNHAKNA